MQSNFNAGMLKHLLLCYRAYLVVPASLMGICFCLYSSLALANANNSEYLTDTPLEELLSKEVVTASRIAKQISDSPSAVSIVTAKDIQSYGYRTLAEIISSMRGLNTVSDHVYTYMSGRGFGRPGDYPGRVMLLIDGHQANDNLYNASYLGNDGILDTELIERVEYVSGPGSVTHGNGAFYGIINIVTKKGSDFDGAQLAFDAASHQTYKERITYGTQFDNGADILLSASTLRSQGQNLYFRDFDSPSTNFGVARNLDDEKNRRLFFKGHYEAWSLESAYVTRKKDDPAASYNANFNTHPSNMQDTNGYVTLRHEDDISDHLKRALKIYYGQYNYSAEAIYSNGYYREKNTGRWWGTEAKFVYSGLDQHRLVYGLEYRNDYQQDFYLPTNDLEHSAYMASAYIQDEYHLSDHWLLNAGVRADHGGHHAQNLSPRLAAIYSPTAALDIKASYATAFRQANAYEKYYGDGSTIIPNPNLNKEMVYASELVFEYRPDSSSKWMSSLFHYTTKDLIQSETVISPAGAERFTNVNRGRTRGIDFEYDKQWSSSSRLKASYAWQLATDHNDKWLANSPKHLAKLNFAHGLFGNHLHAGVEVQYVGSRLTEARDRLGGYTLTNLTLHNTTLIKNTTISASVKNLFNRRYSVPAPTFYLPDSFVQDRSNVWFQLAYDFK